MSDEINSAADVPKPGTPDAALQALSLLFGDAVKHLVTTAESQQTAILALTAMLALNPNTTEVDAKRLGVVVQALTQNRKDAEQARERIAAYVSAIVGLASKMPEALAVLDGGDAKASGNGKSN